MARQRGFDPAHLDVAALAAASAELSGQMPLAALPRLREISAGEPAAGPTIAEWRVRGETVRLGAAGRQPSLRVRAEATLTLLCQRCLQPVDQALQIDRRLVFVEGEEAAAALDAESEDDVLALSASLNLPALLEDELLLALPIVARHAICPQPLPGGAIDAEPAPAVADELATHPFAVLAALKRGALPN